MTSDRPSYQLEVKAEGPQEEFAHITICNGNLETIAKGYHTLNLQLQEGIYSVTMRLNENVEEKVIRLNKDVHEILPTPAVYSSIVASGFESSHEYYTDNAVHCSHVPTADPVQGAHNNSLFVFFRYPDEQAFKELHKTKESLGKGFTLLDAQRKVLYPLTGKNVTESDSSGWLAFHVLLPPGVYYLHYTGQPSDPNNPPREMPLNVFNDWQTQVFLTFGHYPLFPSLKISIQPNKQGFVNNAADNYLLEGVLQKFHNGIYYIPEHLLEQLAHEKWNSPIKGLLAAYVYLSGQKKEQDDFFRIVLDNLAAIFGDQVPDIKALKILAAQHFNEPLPAVAIEEPCMFLAGMKAAVHASAVEPEKEIIRENSIAEQVVQNLYTDMVWTSYLPLPLQLKEESSAETKSRGAGAGDEIESNVFPETISLPGGQLEMSDMEGFSGAAPGLEEGMPAQESKALNTQNVISSWVANSLLYYAQKAPGKMDLTDIAKRLQVTPHVVKKTADFLIQNEDQIGTVLENETDLNAADIRDVFTRSNIDKLKSIF
jgi:hypothetical protein